MVIRALHLLLLPIAATFGWYVGRRDHASQSKVSHQLRQGLNYLIQEQSDQAIDVFLKLSEVDSDTAEIHLALGHLFRQRGEVDRAIRVHQNLLARPELDKRCHVQALFALGQDYWHAGVLDRAEQIFLELAALEEDWNEERHNSWRFLQKIYQQEKAWSKAIDVTRKLTTQTGESADPLLAQFYCEIAEQEAEKGQQREAWEYLHQAIHVDPDCVRANLIAGRLAYHAGEFLTAIRHYCQVKEQDIHFIPEIIGPLCQCYRELGQEKELVDYLEECLKVYPTVSLILIIASYQQRFRSESSAINFIVEQVKNNSSLRGINQLIQLYLNNNHDRPSEKLLLIQSMLQQFAGDKPMYGCGHCGFSAPLLFWNCPSCRHWASIRPGQKMSVGVTV